MKIIIRIKYKINRIPEGFEGNSPLYTKNEVEEKVGSYRNQICNAGKGITRLQEIIRQESINEQNKDLAIKRLASLRDNNLDNATFEEQTDLVTRLGIKVFTSADGKVA